MTEIRGLLETALDCEEEYLEEGAMGTYWPKLYATAAAEQLDSLFRPLGPTDADVIDCCVEALSNPERIKKGRSLTLLIQLRERSRPTLDALSHSIHPQLRIFALEAANTSIHPLYFSPLYGSITLEQRLLNDPEENVRIAAIAGVKQTIARNANYLKKLLHAETDAPLSGLFYQLLALLDDASAKVRAAAAKALGDWASYAGCEALDGFLEREHDPEARATLVMAKTLCNLKNGTVLQ